MQLTRIFMHTVAMVCLLLAGSMHAVGQDEGVVAIKRPLISTLLPEDSLIRQYSEQGSVLNVIPGLSTEPGLDKIEKMFATAERLPGMCLILGAVFIKIDQDKIQTLLDETVPSVYFLSKKTEADMLLKALYSIRCPESKKDDNNN